jgi:8-oxo-dGTP diphosphatase
MKSDIQKIGLAVIRNNKLLILRNAQTQLFLMPGGKVEQGEAPLDTLAREINEELGCSLSTQAIKYLGKFKDWAANDPGRQVIIDLYIGEIEGDILINNEIEELKWFDPNIDRMDILSAIVRNKILPFLIDKGLLLIL